MNIIYALTVVIILTLIGGCYVKYVMKNKSNIMPAVLKAQLRYIYSGGFDQMPDQTYPIKKGGIINLKANKPGDLERYSFKVLDVTTQGITLKQVADELGNKNINGWSKASTVELPDDEWWLGVGQTLIIGRNTPGGGPQWTLSIAGAGTANNKVPGEIKKRAIDAVRNKYNAIDPQVMDQPSPDFKNNIWTMTVLDISANSSAGSFLVTVNAKTNEILSLSPSKE